MSFTSIRKLALAGFAIAVALMVTGSQNAHAVTAALSINLTDGSHLLGYGTSAGVGAYNNWNDMTATGTFAAAGSMKLSNGSFATNAKVDNFAGFGYNPSTAPTGAATAGDQIMMAGGTRPIWNNNGQYVYAKNAIQISGLSGIFSSYEVRVYQGWESTYGSTSKSAAFVASSNAADFGLASAPGSNFAYYNTGSAVGSAMGANNSMTNIAFAGNFAVNNFSLVSGPIAGTNDLLVITDFANSGTTNQFSGITWNAIQIVGELNSVPEPSSIALAGIGLVGLVGYGLRRRNRKSA